MAFDPNKPANLTPIDADELRAQFNALKALLDAQQEQINQRPTNDDVVNLIGQRAAMACGDVDDLQLTVSNPPTQAEMQALADKLHELMFTLKGE